ncbi:MAG: T9SS type A sorting domain-containing protein, partial [Bacteroidota bacterium]
LTLSGDLTNGRRIDVEVMDGSGAGIGHDVLIVADSLFLNDTLRLTETGSAPLGDYEVIICRGPGTCLQGDFTVVELPTDYSYILTDTSVIVTKVILPVELISFEATALANQVQLTWHTSSELNNDYFAIERSEDGRVFHEVGQQNGSGTVEEERAYQFIDRQLPTGAEKFYYRLRQIDIDGTFSFSEVRQVIIPPAEHHLILHRIIPLSSKELNIQFSNNSSNEVRISLLSLAGQELVRNQVDYLTTSYTMQLPALPAGIYLISLSNQRDRVVQKVFLVE